MKLMMWLAAVVGAAWLCRRLWPALRSEPSTWFGEGWREKLPV